MGSASANDTARSYDRVAGDYAKQFQYELDYKPFDRKMLELLVEKVEGKTTR